MLLLTTLVLEVMQLNKLAAEPTEKPIAYPEEYAVAPTGIAP